MVAQIGNDEEDFDENMQSPRLTESVPLLPKSAPTRSRIKSFAELKELSEDVRQQGLQASWNSYGSGEVFRTAHNDKLLLYDHESLLSGKALLYLGLSAFVQRPVIITVIYCICIAATCATAVFFIPKSSKLDSSKFASFSMFLRVFIGFMLGTYVLQSFKRWWHSVSTFEKYLMSVRQMLFLLYTIRGRPEWRKMVDRDQDALLDWLVDNDYLSQDERDVLKANDSDLNHNKSACSKTRAVWSWIGELVSYPKVEEGVAVLPPLLTRTLVLCQACINEIELLKMNITMQMPFMYAQLLAILVHVNNTILALSCGMAVGSSMNEIRRRSEQLSGHRETANSHLETMEQLYGAIQSVGTQIVILILTPVLYVAFLHLAHMLCYPFGDEVYNLPTETLCANLHADINHMGCHRTFFRQKHAEWQDMERKKKTKKDEEEEEDEGDDDDGGEC